MTGRATAILTLEERKVLSSRLDELMDAAKTAEQSFWQVDTVIREVKRDFEGVVPAQMWINQWLEGEYDGLWKSARLIQAELDVSEGTGVSGAKGRLSSGRD